MQPYPYPSDDVLSALRRVMTSPLASDDTPHLNAHEPQLLLDKEIVDLYGVADNLWWYQNRTTPLEVL